MDDLKAQRTDADSPHAAAFHAREGRRALWRGGYRALLCPVTFLFFFRFGVRGLFSQLAVWFTGEELLFSVTADLICFAMTVPLYAAPYVRAYAHYTGIPVPRGGIRLTSLSALLLLLFCTFAVSVAVLCTGFCAAGLFYRHGNADAVSFSVSMATAGCGIAAFVAIFGFASRYLYALHAVTVRGMRAGQALSESRRLCRSYPRLCASLGRRICLWALLSFVTDGLAGFFGTPYCLFCAVSVFENLLVAQPAADTSELILVPRSDESWQKNSI